MAERDDHPLSLELASLRASVAKFQQAAHQSGIQLQGSRLEFTLLSGECRRHSLSGRLLAVRASRAEGAGID